MPSRRAPEMPPGLHQLLQNQTQMLQTQGQILQMLMQNLANNNNNNGNNINNNNLPPGMPQLLESQAQLVQMMTHIMTNHGINPLMTNYGANEPQDNVVTGPRACKICGDIGHTYMEHQDQCPNCDGDHPGKEYPTSRVTCFLCEGTNHVPIQCPRYTIVQQMNQEDKGRRSYAPKETHGDARPPKKNDTHIKLKGTAPHHTTKCCYTCGEDGHMSRNCTKKQKTIFPEFEVKYEE